MFYFKRIARYFVTYFLSVAFVASPAFVFAQGAGFGGEGDMPVDMGMPANTVSCFDYYRFGSVQASITPNVASAVSGTPITFTGSVRNENSYPIVDGSLYVKVFKLRDDPTAKNANGPFVVDQFFVRNGISLPAGGSMPLVFSWDIPSHAEGGEYQVAMFFTTARAYNLLGLSFTDDVVGNTARFRVSGEQTRSVSFDKDAVSINGNDYFFAAFPPRVSATSSAAISAAVQNETRSAVRVPVRFEVYQWDAQKKENLITSEEQYVTVPAGESADATYTVTDTKYPVYLVVATLKWENTQSLLNIRFVREGVERPRINFPGVTGYPLVEGSETTLFSCLHNIGESTISDGRLDLRLVDERGRTIHEYSYAGGVTSAMMGVADSFVPKKTYDRFTLEAALYRGGELVDSASIYYNCAELSPGNCSPVVEESALENLLNNIASRGAGAMAIAFGVLIVLLIMLVWALRKLFSRATTPPGYPY